MSNSDIEQTGTVKGHIPNIANLSGRISNVVSLSGHISIGSGAGDFIIKMTIEVNGNNYIVTSCDKTMEQIDAAVASGQNIKAIAFDKYVMPMTQMEYSESYTFGAFLGSFLIAANVAKNHESGTDDWQFYLSPITADIVEYSNVAMPRISTVSEALDKLVLDSHTHANKSVLDKFAETDGKPTYDGKSLGSGASDFIIKMTVTSDDNGNYTVTSCDATVEQIDAAVSAEKRVVVISTDTENGIIFELPMLESVEGGTYYFGTFLFGRAVTSFVYKVENESNWQFLITQIEAESVSYSNAALPNTSRVADALDALVPKSHTHTNKAVLDKFAETDGKPTYNGEALGSGSGDFIIKMTVESNGSELIVTSCDTTVEQIDEAVAAEKRVVLIASIDGTILELPMIQGEQGYSYYFGAFLSESVLFSTVYKTENTSSWAFAMIQIWAGAVEYSNDALPNVTDVESALNELVPKSHTHANKDTLDKLSDSNGKLQYNGSDVGLKGEKGDTPVKGTDYWTAADKTEIVNDTLAALPTWTGGSY